MGKNWRRRGGFNWGKGRACHYEKEKEIVYLENNCSRTWNMI